MAEAKAVGAGESGSFFVIGAWMFDVRCSMWDVRDARDDGNKMLRVFGLVSFFRFDGVGDDFSLSAVNQFI